MSGRAAPDERPTEPQSRQEPLRGGQHGPPVQEGRSGARRGRVHRFRPSSLQETRVGRSVPGVSPCLWYFGLKRK